MAADTERLRVKLLARIAELDEDERLSAADRAPVVLDRDSVGRLSRLDAMQVQAMALAQARRRQVERNAIGAALRRMGEGEYRSCLTCGEDIAPARLEHNPAATTCISCAGNQQA